MACLDKIIKLSRTTCECFNAPEGYDEGQSEIYLDELEGLSLSGLSGSENCEEGSIWDMMMKARQNATDMFVADLMACINNNYASKMTNFSGVVGDTVFNSTLAISQNTAGLRIRPYEIVGGYMTLKRIGLMFHATGPLTIKVYSNEDFENEIASYNVTTAANVVQFIDLAEPLKLPLWSEKVSQFEYYVVYSVDGSVLPKNNKENCGCNRSSNVGYKNWVSIQGIKGNTPTLFNMFNTTTGKEMNGLVLDLSFTCESNRLICSETFPLDFNDARVKQMGYAVRFKAGQLLIQKILDSPNINRYTLLGREALYGKRNSYEKKYNDWVAWICENTEVKNTDCLKCKPNPNFVRGTILA